MKKTQAVEEHIVNLWEKTNIPLIVRANENELVWKMLKPTRTANPLFDLIELQCFKNTNTNNKTKIKHFLDNGKAFLFLFLLNYIYYHICDRKQMFHSVPDVTKNLFY